MATPPADIGGEIENAVTGNERKCVELFDSSSEVVVLDSESSSQ